MDENRLNALLESMYPDDEILNNFSKILLYGDPGAGKTKLGATIGNRVLFLVADPMGWESLKNHPELGLHTRIKLMKYRGISQLETLATAFDEGVSPFDQYDTVMLDTLSNIASMDLDVVTKTNMATKKSKGVDFNYEDHMRPVYNQSGLRVKAALLKLFLAPVNVVATAHSREVELSATGVKQQRPKFNPDVFAAINGFCSLIGYMTANEAGIDSDGSVKYKRRIQYHPTRSIVAKCRIGGMPVTEDDPDLRSHIEKWQALGRPLLSHDESEEEVPEVTGLNPPVRESNPEQLTEFEL